MKPKTHTVIPRHFHINYSVDHFIHKYNKAKQANVLEISNSPNDKHPNYLHYMVEEEKSYQHSDIQNSSLFIKATDSCDNRIACLTPGYYLNSLGRIVPKSKDFNPIRVNYQSCTANPSNSYSTSYAHDISGLNSRNIKSDVFKPPGNNEESSYSILQSLRVKNVDKIVLRHININSIRNKFDVLVDLTRDKIGILPISETKIDNSFPTSQFGIQGYTPFRLDCSVNRAGILLYTRNDIPAKKLPYLASGNIECIILEITISNKKWFLGGRTTLINLRYPLICQHLPKFSVITHLYMTISY